jgi:hypothetical protein
VFGKVLFILDPSDLYTYQAIPTSCFKHSWIHLFPQQIPPRASHGRHCSRAWHSSLNKQTKGQNAPLSWVSLLVGEADNVQVTSMKVRWQLCYKEEARQGDSGVWLRSGTQEEVRGYLRGNIWAGTWTGREHPTSLLFPCLPFLSGCEPPNFLLPGQEQWLCSIPPPLSPVPVR